MPATEQGLSSVISHVTLTVLWGVGFIAPVTPEMVSDLPRSQSWKWWSWNSNSALMPKPFPVPCHNFPVRGYRNCIPILRFLLTEGQVRRCPS